LCKKYEHQIEDYGDIGKDENWYHTRTILPKEIEKLATYERI
jgi:hypothetical protein